MNAKNLLDQLLSSGQAMLSETLGSRAPANPAQAPGKPGYANFGTGMLAGGVLGLLLGDKRVRKFGGKALAYGGAAALGALAFRAYSDWQRQKSAAAAPATEPARFLPAPTAEGHSRAVLKALIAAAKSDGHIDARERGLIEEKLAGLADDPALRSWIDAEVARPLDPSDVAAAAGSMEVASEMYLVSVLAVDAESFMERAYLDELGRKLDLPDDLKLRLETEARQALAAT
ncbi:MAG: tellurite resistance TerB family protein [Thiobacillus sp.]|uniref:tellurite resistance TerB family protein n=1 Tax=Thiobacillus sp. TaxID=924 RepID=UPI002893AE92|nr:tellurite resistance TerB family protein [Thiobacillus sp.]MDT3705971.1 tellurite resistance TerB family protein [Thiobacillus sp.]